MSEATEKFESWAIVEVMGHQRFAGFASDATLGGAGMLRIDVPEVDGRPAFTKFVAPAALFAVTPCTEATAKEAAKRFRSRPFAMFELQMMPQIEHQRPDFIDPDEDEFTDTDDDFDL